MMLLRLSTSSHQLINHCLSFTRHGRDPSPLWWVQLRKALSSCMDLGQRIYISQLWNDAPTCREPWSGHNHKFDPPRKLVTHDTWSIAVIEWFTKTGFLVEIWEGSPFFLWLYTPCLRSVRLITGTLRPLVLHRGVSVVTRRYSEIHWSFSEMGESKEVNHSTGSR